MIFLNENNSLCGNIKYSVTFNYMDKIRINKDIDFVKLGDRLVFKIKALGKLEYWLIV